MLYDVAWLMVGSQLLVVEAARMAAEVGVCFNPAAVHREATTALVAVGSLQP